MSLGMPARRTGEYANFEASGDGTGYYVIGSESLRLLYPPNEGGGCIVLRNYGTKGEPNFVGQFNFGFIEGVLQFARRSSGITRAASEQDFSLTESSESGAARDDTMLALQNQLSKAYQRIEHLEGQVFSLKDESGFIYNNMFALFGAVNRARDFDEMKIHLNTVVAKFMREDDKQSRKRKRTAAAQSGEAPSPATSSQPGRSVSSNPLRFDFQWRGRDLRGLVQVNPVRNHGFVEFSDGEKTKFTGQIGGVGIGDSFDLEGEVIDGMPAVLDPEKTWQSYHDPFAVPPGN
ncbi:hypothetical protein K431DRAFT_290225 [Polychaeton citri CBS 116435]|uniref:Uncharacterized protein n=1 Tax=Polychaeton citri CBS 116435 TaxID=1314669 RepID=A0A9P4QHH9_9PEZI|nr:hypothetical protein K431DRAFT_290225 [Polychaeton citri CBS 116435]